MAGSKGGLYASHIRGESAEFLDAVTEAIRIGEEGGAGVEIFHMKAAYYPNWGKDMASAIALVDAARARGVNVAADIYPYVQVAPALKSLPRTGCTLTVLKKRWSAFVIQRPVQN